MIGNCPLAAGSAAMHHRDSVTHNTDAKDHTAKCIPASYIILIPQRRSLAR